MCVRVCKNDFLKWAKRMRLLDPFGVSDMLHYYCSLVIVSMTIVYVCVCVHACMRMYVCMYVCMYV